jgi:hypothetical protein
MANVSWSEAPSVWIASLDNVAVCALKTKDIGGCVASWLDGRMWAPPVHLPKATPQPTRFFMGLTEAKEAVEQALNTP